jgi:fructose-1,6-bisphosphatase/inositol monophosphatase family enzyme
VCTGEVDATVYVHSHPWDHLPGALMLRELGGVVRSVDGTDYAMSEIPHQLLVAAGDEQAYQTVARALRA